MHEVYTCNDCDYIFTNEDLADREDVETFYSDPENETNYTDIEHVPERSEFSRSSMMSETYKCPKCGNYSTFEYLENH